MNYLGCAWYPEAWAPERWETDLKLMQEAGIKAVRMGEFNWGKFEPEEGRYDFAAYRELMPMLKKHGLVALMCTPTAAPPKWMSARYPEILKMDADGLRVSDGNRRHYCPSSTLFRSFSRRIVQRLAETFAAYEEVVAWQVDNELAAAAETGLCFCQECRRQFIAYLQRRYGSVQELNRAWNGAFWSSDFASFEDIEPRSFVRPCCLLEYRRFMSSLYVEFACEQRDILRQANPLWKISTNSWTTYLPDVAPDELFKELDFATCDSYIHNDHLEATHACWDFYRTVKGCPRPFTVGETAPGNPVNTHAEAPKAVESWAWDALAHGAENLFYFRWRQSVMGEEEHPAILPASGRPGLWYDQVARTCHHLNQFAHRFPNLPLPVSKVAILVDRQTGFMAGVKNDFSFYHIIVRLVKVLNELGVTADLIPTSAWGTDGMNYRLVILPQLDYVPDEVTDQLRSYQAQGGQLLALGHLNRTDENGKYLMTSYPSRLQDVFGLRIDESCPIRSHVDFGRFDYTEEACVPSMPDFIPAEEVLGQGVCLKGFMERIVRDECRVLATYPEGIYRGEPMLTEHHGAFYLGCQVNERGLRVILEKVFLQAGIETMELPPRCVRIRRGKVMFYVNNTSEPVLFKDDELELGPYGIAWQEDGAPVVVVS